MSRVSLYTGQQSPGYGPSPGGYERSSMLVGAQDALVATPGNAVFTRGSVPTVVVAEPVLEQSADASEVQYDEVSEQDEDDEDDEELDVEDDSVVYLTESYREWECHYLRRLAKSIHRLVCAQLEHRSEEALLMLFIEHDKNLDGVVTGGESTALLAQIEEMCPGAKNHGAPGRRDGSISFVSLLRWYVGFGGHAGHQQDTTYRFSLTALSVGLLGSGYVGSDSRLQDMDWLSLRQNILGYRRMLNQLRRFEEERALQSARQLESKVGLENAMQEYHNVLSREFESDAEHLFEIFCQVDESGNLLLEAGEIEAFLRLLDTGASETDLRRYIAEIRIEDEPLSFASLIDWWEQARHVANSLVSEKGTALIASIKAQALAERMGGLVAETTYQKRWSEAKSANRLSSLRQAYCRTLSELREYKIERDLRAAEKECEAV